ncbi:MAG: peptidylprolyl isomerase [Gammaproteobacteria bacterium]|nr:peptidylprolyl isomerase [Gammaproteobacteria bacterium]
MLSTLTHPVIADKHVVTFTYVILDEARQVLEQSDLPMSYIHGVDGKMFPKVEQYLLGANEGAEIEVPLSAEEAFGPHNPELAFTDSLENVPPPYRRVGAEAMFQNDKGDTMTMVVTRIDNGQITLDGNHPFAGKNLLFRIHVVTIRAATPQELAQGNALDTPGPLTYQ